jgi:hypothetical protein
MGTSIGRQYWKANDFAFTQDKEKGQGEGSSLGNPDCRGRGQTSMSNRSTSTQVPDVDNNHHPQLLANSMPNESTLKYLIGVMAQRHQNGIIPPKYTFKPPPRVILTDAKREMWLRDLTNPAVFLRKLSRTIPHGIRGKILLEQCLNKKIPNDGAIWLAKCVGANEIRAFKRKGVNEPLCCCCCCDCCCCCCDCCCSEWKVVGLGVWGKSV